MNYQALAPTIPSIVGLFCTELVQIAAYMHDYGATRRSMTSFAANSGCMRAD
jgi:hypothetical protein